MKCNRRDQSSRRRSPSLGSGEDVLHNAPMDVSEPEIAARVAVGEAFVIDAEKMEDGRMEIVYVNRMLGHIDAELVRTAVSHSTLDATTREHHREGSVVMIPADLLD